MPRTPQHPTPTPTPYYTLYPLPATPGTPHPSPPSRGTQRPPPFSTPSPHPVGSGSAPGGRRHRPAAGGQGGRHRWAGSGVRPGRPCPPAGPSRSGDKACHKPGPPGPRRTLRAAGTFQGAGDGARMAPLHRGLGRGLRGIWGGVCAPWCRVDSPWQPVAPRGQGRLCRASPAQGRPPERAGGPEQERVRRASPPQPPHGDHGPQEPQTPSSVSRRERGGR